MTCELMIFFLLLKYNKYRSNDQCTSFIDQAGQSTVKQKKLYNLRERTNIKKINK